MSPLALVIALIALWLGLAWWLKGPLAGVTTHDFGRVPMTVGSPAKLEHTFELRNRTGSPITIRAARPDCGCVYVNRPFPVEIAPGQTIELPITMNFSGPQRTVLIHLDCGDAGMQSLRASAIAAYQTQLGVSQTHLEFPNNGGSMTLEIVATVYGSDKPDAPAFIAPPGFVAEFGGWRLHWQSGRTANSPSEWRAEVTIRNVDRTTSLPPDAVLVVELPPALAVKVPMKAREAGASQP